MIDKIIKWEWQWYRLIYNNSNSMVEDEGISQFSMTTAEQTKTQQQQKVSIIKHYLASLILICMGFYFLVFGIIELVTNYSEHKYTSYFACDDYACTAAFQDVSFPDQENVYLYLINTQFTQNLLEGINTNTEEIISNCNHDATNQQINKLVSLTGTSLPPTGLAYPCGEIAMYYPEAVFTVRNTDTNAYANINLDDLSITHYQFTNINLASQWANVENSRYSIWSEKHIALGIKKYWGYITDKISGNFQIKFTSTNKLKNQLKNNLKIEITDNQALSGYNIHLCVSNFMWAVVMFIFGCVSFYIIGKQRHIFNKQPQNSVQNLKQQIPQYSYSIHQ